MKIYQVDAFTDRAFQGNPACVCLLDENHPDSWMQSLAGEMNLSETAFLLKQTRGFDLRWFTPMQEVSLCGHATLAAAHILWEERYLQPEENIEFNSKSGLLTIMKDKDWIEMDFPTKLVVSTDENLRLNQALGITPKHTSKSSSPKGDLYLIEVESEELVRAVTPDFEQLLASGARITIVTSCSREQGVDFVSRFFAPAIGINEDPVTGSAHCYLAPYWGARLNKHSLIGFQVSERKGIVGCNWKDERVILRGKAITIYKGELMV